MKRVWVVLMVLLVGMEAFAFDEWSKAEIAMEAGYIALHVVDWGQTLDLAHECSLPGDRHEHNPFLGREPSRTRVNTYFLSTIVIQPVVAHILPSTWRKAWIASGVMIEASCVANNHRIGIRMTF